MFRFTYLRLFGTTEQAEENSFALLFGGEKAQGLKPKFFVYDHCGPAEAVPLLQSGLFGEFFRSM